MHTTITCGGVSSIGQWTRDGNSKALDHFAKAIELEPGFAAAHGMAAFCYVQRKARGWMKDQIVESGEATRLAGRAVLVGKDDPVALCMGGYALAFIVRKFEDAAAFMDRGLTINPNYAMAWRLSAWLRLWMGEPAVALAHAANAMRLSPLDPAMFSVHAAAAYAHFLAHRYDEASSWAERAMRENPNFELAIWVSAASNALAGRIEAAQQATSLMLERDPEMHLSNLGNQTAFRRPEDLALITEGLRKAGFRD